MTADADIPAPHDDDQDALQESPSATGALDPPHLHTDRLFLRPPEDRDAPELTDLLRDGRVAAMVLIIPHPYEEAHAQQFIDYARRQTGEGKSLHLLITHPDGQVVLGAVGLQIGWMHRHAEIGYWLGVPFWGHGYATEAAGAVLRYAFDTLQLHRVFAHHMTGNDASGRVLQKIGMQREGVLRQHIRKDERFVDLVHYGILRSDYDQRVQARVDQ